MSAVRYHGMVLGRVQGVGFRFFARDAALRRGLVGWVRNVAQGNVEFEVQGEQEIVDAFVAHLRKGPPLSRVLDIALSPVSQPAEWDSFSIRS